LLKPARGRLGRTLRGIRAVPGGEAMVSLVLADHLLRHRAQNG